MRLVLIATIVLAISTSAVAQVPQIINYQGHLSDDMGVPVNGDRKMVFAIWDSPSGGNKLWEETQPNVTIMDGLFQVKMGSFVPINLSFDESYWLEVEVDDVKLSPRMRLTSVGYSFFSMRADSAYSLSLDAANASNIVDEPGVAFDYGPDAFTLINSANNQTVISLSIDVPAAGFVVLEASGYLNVVHNNGSTDNIVINVLIDEAEWPFTSGASSFTIPSPLPGATYRYPFACRRIESASAGPLVAHLVVRQLAGANIASTEVNWSVLQATYYPTNYGIGATASRR